MSYYLLFVFILFSTSHIRAEWNIKCLFDKQHNNIFWAGKQVTGVIEFFNVEKSNVKLERIKAELIGEFHYKSEYKTSGSTSRNSSKLIFLNDETIVHPIDSPGTFSVSYGKHSWPFSFELSVTLPPTLDSTDSDALIIEYFIRVTFVQAESDKWNIDKIFPIIIKNSPLRVTSTKLEVEKENRKKVHLRAIVHNNVVAPGSNIVFDISIRNPKKSRIRRITATLYRIEKSGSENEKQSRIISRDLEKIRNFESINFNETYQLQVPHTVPATFSYKFAINSTAMKMVTVAYKMTLDADLSGFFTNIQLQLPIIVANPIENDTNNSEESD